MHEATYIFNVIHQGHRATSQSDIIEVSVSLSDESLKHFLEDRV